MFVFKDNPFRNLHYAGRRVRIRILQDKRIFLPYRRGHRRIREDIAEVFHIYVYESRAYMDNAGRYLVRLNPAGGHIDDDFYIAVFIVFPDEFYDGVRVNHGGRLRGRYYELSTC